MMTASGEDDIYPVEMQGGRLEMVSNFHIWAVICVVMVRSPCRVANLKAAKINLQLFKSPHHS